MTDVERRVCRRVGLTHEKLLANIRAMGQAAAVSGGHVRQLAAAVSRHGLTFSPLPAARLRRSLSGVHRFVRWDVHENPGNLNSRVIMLGSDYREVLTCDHAVLITAGGA